LPSTFRRQYALDPQSLSTARQEVAQFALLCGLDSVQADDVVIAVGEAISNIVEHSKTASLFSPHCECDGGRLAVIVEDNGEGFALPLRLPPATSWDARGLGMLIMNRLMDKVELSTKPGRGTTLRLEKQR
jgi:stage II sporulation protein AB (anti-sigma F factor)